MSQVIESSGGWASQLSAIALYLIASEESSQRIMVEHHTGGGLFPRSWVMHSLIPIEDVVVIDDWNPPAGGRMRWIRRQAFALLARFRRQVASPNGVVGEFEVLTRDDPTQDSISHMVTAWSALSDRIRSAGLPDFTRPGCDESIAIHYRLGDYRKFRTARRFHGVVRPDRLAEEVLRVRSLVGAWPVRVFSDEPSRAAWRLARLGVRNIEVAGRGRDSEIWAEAEAMAQSAWFIGTNSGVSIMVALGRILSERASTPLSGVSLPTPWFREGSYRTLVTPGEDIRHLAPGSVRLYRAD